MRKIFIFILVLLLTACSSFSDLTEIEAINLHNGESTLISMDTEDAQIILEAINKKNKSDISPSSWDYELILKKDSGSEAYKLFFDLEKEDLYLSQDDQVYKLRDKWAESMFVAQVFSYIYTAETIPASYVDIGGRIFSPEIEYNWNSKNIGGHFVNNSGIVKGQDGKDSAIAVLQGDPVSINHDREADSQIIKVYDQDSLIASGTNFQDVLAKIKDDGEYRIECQSQWRLKENSSFYGKQVLKFNLLIDNPASINILSKENYPGSILLIAIDNLNQDESIKLTTEAVKIENENYGYKGKDYFLFPIDLYTKPGDYTVTALVNQGKSDEYMIEEILTVENKSFKTQYLTVSEDMNQTHNDNTAIYEFAQLVKPARTESTSEKLWEGPFIIPVEGRLTTDFAEIRYVNNEPSSSRHSGLDLAAPTGTPILAPNNGIVTFAMEGLLSPGSTVVIDHGMGLFTSYYHLNSIDVEVGDYVEKGEVIGSVGSTGFSTGPHLHYSVSIYNTYVNPYETLSGIID